MARLLGVYGFSQLIKYIKKAHYQRDSSHFTDKEEWLRPLHIVNWLTEYSGPDFLMYKKLVGIFDALDPNPLNVTPTMITWKHNVMPKGQCNERCPAGKMKVLGEGYHICCYNCTSCPDGEFTSITDQLWSHRSSSKRQKALPKLFPNSPRYHSTIQSIGGPTEKIPVGLGRDHHVG
ncbi:taste receptor type 1 member 1-like isoform X2 [Dendropsophus ebraccatus]|uniref:taste receptor type 1 member 1-like isoform X2 n=1 Tax=Dendropsophus ebraccatus TaxID=150705 RepID=UPI003831B5D2